MVAVRPGRQIGAVTCDKTGSKNRTFTNEDFKNFSFQQRKTSLEYFIVNFSSWFQVGRFFKFQAQVHFVIKIHHFKIFARLQGTSFFFRLQGTSFFSGFKTQDTSIFFRLQELQLSFSWSSKVSFDNFFFRLRVLHCSILHLRVLRGQQFRLIHW